MSQQLHGGVNTPASVGAQGRKAKPESLSHEGNLNPVTLRSLLEINHISYLLNGLLSLYGLCGSLSEASAGLTLSWKPAPAAPAPPRPPTSLFGKCHSQMRGKNTSSKGGGNKEMNAFPFLFVAKLGQFTVLNVPL